MEGDLTSLEGDIASMAISWAATSEGEEKIGLIKRLLNTCNAKELDDAWTILRHIRRKKLKPKPTKVPIPVPVSLPSTDVSSPGQGWWSEWIDDYGQARINAFDCEMVTKPKHPDRCVQKHWIDKKTGQKFIKFLPKILTESIEYEQMAATVSICDFDGELVYSDIVYHEPGSYIVNNFTFKLNGITWSGLREGIALSEVTKRCDSILKTNLNIGCDMVNDYNCLDLKPNDYLKFDLQQEYKGPVVNQGVVSLMKHSLRSIYFYYFKKNVQEGVHLAEVDAIATMKIFKEGYIPDKLISSDPMSQQRMKMYDDDEMPRLK